MTPTSSQSAPVSLWARLRERSARRWRRIVSFVQEREDPTSLALFRIMAGTSLCAHLLHMLMVGAPQFVWVSPEYGGMGARARVLEFFGATATAGNVLVLTWLCVVASFCVAVGLFTRLSILVTWLSFRAILDMSNDARSGYDSLLINIMFLLLLSGCGGALSLDARLFGRVRAVARWPRVLAVFQIGLLYGGSAVMKASSGWVPGGGATALWYIMHQPMWSRLNGLPDWAYPLSQLATTMTWFWELAGPLFFVAVLLRESDASTTKWPRLKRALDRVRFRELWLLMGVMVHIGIELTMEVGIFSEVSVALYFCALRPDEWRALPSRTRALLARLLRRRPAPAPI